MTSIPSARITRFSLASTATDEPPTAGTEGLTPHSGTASPPISPPPRTSSLTPNSSPKLTNSSIQSPYLTSDAHLDLERDESACSSSSSLTYASQPSITSLPSTTPFNLDNSPTQLNQSSVPPPLPPRLPKLDTLTSSPSAASPHNLSAKSSPVTAPDRLPTYADLESADAASAAPRFGRWRGWIEKRAQERADIVHGEDRGASKGWGEGGVEGNDLRRGISERHVQAERRMLEAGAIKAGIIPEMTGDLTPGSSAGPSSSRGPPPSLPPRPGTTPDRPITPAPIEAYPLTASLKLEPIGSKFARHVLEQPLCSVVLPAGGRGAHSERFVLVGTVQGLYVVDLHPALSSGHLSLSAAEPLTKAVVLPLWEGLGVHQLVLHLEPAGRTGVTPRGVVFGLARAVEDPVGGELRMWSLATLTHLAQWRCHNPDGPPLDLAPSPLARTSGSISREHKRASTGAFFKGLVAAGSTKTLGRRPSSRIGPATSPKGKGRVLDPPLAPSGRASSDVQRDPLAADHSGLAHIDAGSVARHALREGSATSSHSRNSSTDSIDSAVLIDKPDSTESLPMEWAHASVVLSLPKGHSPISFFRICRAPPSDRVSVLRDYDDEPHSPSPDGYMYAIVVTVAKLVYVYESAPGEQRRWQLLKELYAPSTPRFVKLVRSPGPVASSATSKRHSSSLPAQANPNLYSTASADLCLVLGLSTGRAVLIRLSDLTVVELSLDWAGEVGGDRRGSLSGRADSPAPSAGSIGGGFGRRAFNKISKVASAASAVLEGSGGLPAGMRDDEARGLSKGVRRGEGESAGNEHGSPADLVAPSKTNWVGCDELRLPALTKVDFSGVETVERAARCLYLITKGVATHLAVSPFGFAPARLLNSSRPGTPPSQASSPGGMSGTPGALLIKPVHTFMWPRAVSRVVAMLKSRDELVPELGETHRLLVLLGVHDTGVFVQEGLLNLDAVDELFAPTRASSMASGSPMTRPTGGQAKVGPAVFVRTRGTRATPLRREREAGAVDGERDDSIEVDFGRRTAMVSLGVKEAGERVYLAVEGRADWQLQALE